MNRMFRAVSLLLSALCLLWVPLSYAAGPAWIDVNGISLRYELSGSGPQTLVLLPSTGKPLEYWDEILPALQAPDRKILRYDLRGSGMSAKLSDVITMQDEVDDLRGLLDALKITGPVMMVGTAFGGSIQLQFAAQAPERVKGIVNISPSAQLIAKPARPLTDTTPPPHPPGDPFAITYPVELRGNQERWNKYMAMHASNDTLSKRITERLIYSTPFAEVMPKIKCPVLLVATTMYVRRTVESIEELAKSIPDGRFVVIESGHDAPFQTPEMVVPLLKDFFKELKF